MNLKEIDKLIEKVPMDEQLNKKIKEYSLCAKICKIAFTIFAVALVLLMISFFIIARKDLSNVVFNPFRIVIACNFVIAIILLALNYFLNFEKLRLINKAYKNSQENVESDNADNKQN